MKICFISSYPPDKEGVAVYTERLVNGLKKEGIKADVLTFKKNQNKNNNIWKVLSSNPISLIKTYNALKQINPDVIHVQYAISIYRFYSLFLWVILSLFRLNNRAKVVVTFHEIKRETDSLKLIGLIYYNLFSRIFDLIFVHTLEAREILTSKCKVNKLKIKVMSHGTYEFKSKKDFSEEIIERFGLEYKNLILYFGYIHVDKGIEYLIKASKILFDENAELKQNTLVLIAGTVRPRKGIFKIFEKKDKEYLESLIDIKEKLNLNESVRFMGFIEDKYVYSLLKLAKIVVMPYTNVEQSGVLNSALAVHKPVIASNLGGLKETLQDSGVLVPPKNPKKIAESIERLIRDKPYYNSIMDKYREIDKKNNTQNTINNLIKSYKELLK